MVSPESIHTNNIIQTDKGCIYVFRNTHTHAHTLRTIQFYKEAINFKKNKMEVHREDWRKERKSQGA